MASEGRHRWAAVRGGKLAWGRFREHWDELPRRAWVRWLTIILPGLAITALLMAAATWHAKGISPRWLQRWDTEWLHWIVQEDHVTFDQAIWWESIGNSAMLIPVVVGALLLAIWAGRPIMSLTILAAYVLHEPIVQLGWRMWDRARPDFVAGGVAAPPMHSFPSGHAVQTMAVYGFFTFLWIRASDSWLERIIAVLLMAALAVLVNLARLRLGTHWPSDVIVGSAIGAVWLAVLILALRAAERAGGR